jgi:hypothetical protein
MRKILILLLSLITITSFAQHKYVLKVKGRTDTALIESISSKLNLQDVTNSGHVTTNKIKIANLNISGIPTYPRQDSAVKYGLVSGDVYKLPVDSNNNSILAVVNNSPETNFNLIIDNSNNNTDLRFKVAAFANFNLTIEWGDGQINHYTGANTYLPIHVYSTAGIFRAVLLLNDNSLARQIVIGSDYSDNCNVSAFHNAQIFTNLQGLDIEGTELKLWTYSDGLPQTLTSSWLSSNKMGPAELDKLLLYFDRLVFNAGPKDLFIGYQSSGLGPTSEGLSAISSLQLKGWNVHY